MAVAHGGGRLVAMSDRRRVVLDTDLGSDVDDALALALLLGSPEVDLLGVTTTYGDTALRARATSRLLQLAGVPGPGEPDGLPVRAGAGEPLSGAEVWWAGHEGTLLGDLSTAPVTPVTGPEDAADWVARTAAATAGGVDLLAIGPLTGVALALRRAPSLARDLRSLVVMGGRWDDGDDGDEGGDEAEHNLRSDAVAAAEVLTCGAPTLVVGLEVTQQVHLSSADVERIAGAGPLGAALAAQVHQWRELWGERWGVPHDPVTALLLCQPDLLELGPPGRAEVDDRGVSVHVPDPAGTVRVATGVDAAGAAAAVVERVLRGCART